MKILILNPILFSGDGDRLPEVKTIKDTMIYGMCMGFKALGHDVTLTAMEEYRPTEKEDYDFKILFFKNNLIGKFPSALPWSFAMHRYVKEHQAEYDMIVASETFGFHTLSAAMYAPGKTLIWQELNVHQKKFHKLPSKFWHNIIVSLFYGKVRCVVGRSVSARTFISGYVKRVDHDVVDHGIDIETFAVSEEKRRQFISVAQLIKRKNIDGIITKFSDFLKTDGYGDYRLLLAGRGPMEEELKALTKELGIERNVKFLGFLGHKELNEKVSQSLAFLVNTSQDLNMVSIPESIVSGTPILTNMVPALAGFVNERKLGIACDDWSAKEMTELAENNDYAANCVAIRKELSSEYAASKLIAIWNQYENTSDK